VFFPTAFSMLLAGVSPESEEVSIISPEKQAAGRAGGKDFCLTPREKQVIMLVVAGYTNKGIAHELGVSEQTIRHQAGGLEPIGTIAFRAPSSAG
jgi:DNA-binding NarL/FixJ family response regulator